MKYRKMKYISHVTVITNIPVLYPRLVVDALYEMEQTHPLPVAVAMTALAEICSSVPVAADSAL